jgi:hypothetical protein
MNRRIYQGVAAFALASVLVGPAVLKAASKQISGTGVQVASCNALTSDFTIDMSGDLDGCWYTSILDSTLEPSGVYHETGTESFVGCLREGSRVVGCGTFHTVYHFNAKYTPDFAEIHGRCEHKIVSGTGVFSGGGRIDMKDDVVNAIFDYRGHIVLP